MIRLGQLLKAADLVASGAIKLKQCADIMGQIERSLLLLASMGPLALAGAGIVTGCTRLATSKRLSALPSTWRQPPSQGSGVAGSAVATTPVLPLQF